MGWFARVAAAASNRAIADVGCNVAGTAALRHRISGRVRSAALACTTALAPLACAEVPAVPCHERPGYLCPLAGTGDLGFNGDGLAAGDTELFLPSAARRGPDGRVYVMDFNNQRLRVIDSAGAFETVAGNGDHALADVQVLALDSPLENPIDFRFLSDGQIVFVSYHDPRVLLLGPGGTLEVLAGTGEPAVLGSEGDGGPAQAASFIQLDGIAVSPDDEVFVSDSLANRVRRIADGTIHTVAGTGEAGYDGDGGPGTAASLHWPTALELGGDGTLYIADSLNHAVRALRPDGTIDTVAGTGQAGAAGDGGPARAAQLNQPFGLAMADDALVIADRGNFRLRQVDGSGHIETLAGTGEKGLTLTGTSAGQARLGHVARIAADAEGLLVTDQSNCLVHLLTDR